MTPVRIHTPEQLGRAIRDERRAQDLRQEDLALAAGVGRRFIIELEGGKSNARLGPALEVLRTLGLVVELSSGRAQAEPRARA